MPRLKLYFEFVLECDIDNLYWNVTLIICRLYICDMKYVQGSLVSYICAEIHVKYIEYFQCFLTCA